MSTATSNASTDTNGRDTNGRFAKGNAGGPGNPFARRVAELRRTVMTVLADSLEPIVRALVEKAAQGDLGAAKLLFQYGLGKPADTVDPDRLDADEWQKLKETAPIMQEAAAVLQSPEPSLPILLVRETRPAVTKTLARTFRDMLEHPENYRPEQVELEMAEDDDPPSTNGFIDDDPPSANGDNGAAPPSANGGNGDEATWLAILAERIGLNKRPPTSAHGR